MEVLVLFRHIGLIIRISVRDVEKISMKHEETKCMKQVCVVVNVKFGSHT